MYTCSFRMLAISTLIWGSGASARAASLDLSQTRSLDKKVTHAARTDPCQTGAETTAHPKPSWRAQLSRRTAIYVIQHVQKACRILTASSDKDPQSALLAPQLNSILDDLYGTILGPIYRSHRDLESAVLPELPSQKVPRATRRDVGRTTATRLSEDLTRLQQQIYKLGAQGLDQRADKSAAEKALQPLIDAAAELSFAEKIAFDAYPDLFAKKFDAIPKPPRTEESDASFRKSAPPLGSVRLSDSALTLIESFMRQVRRDMPKSDQIASIEWAKEQKAKGPGDADWIDRGAGWVLGAYPKTQVPPEVIDKVGGIEIVFRAEDPSSLAGKIVDAKHQKLFVRD
jgi:hypothetical protein